ncbi:MAG: hypothetical protein H6617_04165 [Bdellovibrionaceae bacterium]|nr:hypothetical protein [Bdellovibrionales bacterium]MCB9253854.1 hypothetical protein [Pseudobdellovibrionaceae bacterium]
MESAVFFDRVVDWDAFEKWLDRKATLIPLHEHARTLLQLHSIPHASGKFTWADLWAGRGDQVRTYVKSRNLGSSQIVLECWENLLIHESKQLSLLLDSLGPLNTIKQIWYVTGTSDEFEPPPGTVEWVVSQLRIPLEVRYF